MIKTATIDTSPGVNCRPAETITGIDQLPGEWVADHKGLSAVVDTFPMKINRYLFSLIQSPDDPLGRQVVPHGDELKDAHREVDPLAETRQSPVPQVIHRYPHRVVFLVSNQCAVHCRFCMRKRRVAGCDPVSDIQLGKGFDYIRRTPQINEVILSGGDPFMLGDTTIFSILKKIREIKHVRIIRIHTRIPAVWPQRITSDLAHLLSGFHPLYINIHFNHPAEITSDTVSACSRLADAGIALGSQSVLLKGINDNARTLKELFEKLLAIRVKPYYLHQVDRVPGTAHFQVPLEKGINLIAELRGTVSGMAMPHFMIDIPQGGGKVALTPEAVTQKNTHCWLIRNWQGTIYEYPLD